MYLYVKKFTCINTFCLVMPLCFNVSQRTSCAEELVHYYTDLSLRRFVHLDIAATVVVFHLRRLKSSCPC